MLAKQVWRLINKPGSLCAHVLREKYYLYGNILKAFAKKDHPLLGEAMWLAKLLNEVTFIELDLEQVLD
jgi:hypothetical protein